MKKKYMKPMMRSVNAYAERPLLAGSGEDANAFGVATNLDGLGGFGGGGNASFGD